MQEQARKHGSRCEQAIRTHDCRGWTRRLKATPRARERHGSPRTFQAQIWVRGESPQPQARAACPVIDEARSVLC